MDGQVNYPIIIERAKTSDVKTLTFVQKKSFEDDVNKGLYSYSEIPKDYKSEALNSVMVRNDIYYKIRLEDYETIGGVSIVPRGKDCFIKRIFIHPHYKFQGIGKQVLVWLENEYQNIENWRVYISKENDASMKFFKKCIKKS